MYTVRDVCKRIGEIICDNPLCVETGTMYTCPPGNEPHNTTSNIMEFICGPRQGQLISLDIDPEHIEFSKNFCSKYQGRLDHMLGDSVESLRRLSGILRSTVTTSPSGEIRLTVPSMRIDLLCLDGKEFDEDHMVNEFNAIEQNLSEKHFILVDDIHNPNSVKYKKMVPILKKLDYSSLEVSTPTGMFVAWRGYELYR